MADDIVTRLRQEHVVGWVHPAGECVTCDAADEIERLRAAIRNLLNFIDSLPNGDVALDAWLEARRG